VKAYCLRSTGLRNLRLSVPERFIDQGVAGVWGLPSNRGGLEQGVNE